MHRVNALKGVDVEAGCAEIVGDLQHLPLPTETKKTKNNNTHHPLVNESGFPSFPTKIYVVDKTRIHTNATLP